MLGDASIRKVRVKKNEWGLARALERRAPSVASEGCSMLAGEESKSPE